MKAQRSDTENKQNKKTQSDSVFFGCICILIAAFVCQKLIIFYWDNDFYHIATSGRWISENGFMRENVFFVEPGYATVIQQWLYAILLYHSYRTAGCYGVLLFTLLQAVLFGVAGYFYLIRRGTDRRLSVIGALLVVLSVKDLNCRPEILSLVLFTVQLICQEEYFRKRKAGFLYVLPLLVLLESNLHAAYALFHFVLLLPYLIPMHRLPICRELCESCGIRTEKPQYRDFIVPVLLMGIALFLNPYGLRSVMILFYSGNIRMLGIEEMKQTGIGSDGAVLLVFEILFLAIALYRKKLRESTMLMCLGCTFLGLIAVKNLLFITMVLLLLAGDLSEELDCSAFWNILAKVKRNYAYPALGGAIVLSMGLLLYGTILRIPEDGGSITNGLVPEQKDTEMQPQAAVGYILANEDKPEDLRVMTSFNNGSFFLWNGIGHVYLEPKTEPYLRSINGKWDVISEYVQIISQADAGQIAAFLDRYDFDYICCSGYMQGLQVYLEHTDGYVCVMVSEMKQERYEKETGFSQPVYYLYQKK